VDARVRSGEAAWTHIEAEYGNVVDDIMATLVPDGPYAYTVIPTSPPPTPGAIPYQKFVSSRADLRASYEDMNRFAATRPFRPAGEIRADWYVFIHGLAEGLIRSIDQVMQTQAAVLFPTSGESGITGELLWNRSATGSSYTGGREGPLAAETAILERHEALLAGLRHADAGAVARLFHSDAQIGIRDYVNDTGALAEMHSAEDLRHYLESFFARFNVHEISIVHRLATDWFVFSELLWIVEERREPGRRQTFYTAQHGEVLSDGRFACLIGHGTERSAI
jgi:hypothetical protein